MGGGTQDRIAQLVDAQRTYYDLRADDYGSLSHPDRRAGHGLVPPALTAALVDEFSLGGDVLELACGSGSFTRELLRHARSVTAVDGSARMLDRNRREVADPRVSYLEADIFNWQP